MKHILIVICCVLSLTIQVRADDVDTGVGENGVALLSSPSFEEDGVPVDMFNIVRAETAKYFAEETILSGGNTMRHERTGIDLGNQTVIRSNFDLIYSYGVYDVSGGLEITVPPYDLYQIVQVFDENHVTLAVVYPGESVKLGKDDVTYGDHVYLFMRTQRRTPDEKGLTELNQRQDAVVIKNRSKAPYVSEVKYDPVTFNALRKHLLTTGIKKAIIHEGFVDDPEDIVFPHYQMVNLGGWAGLPAKHAFYFVVTPGDDAARKGEPSSMTFMPPPVQYGKNGYWSLTLYNEQGWVATENFNTNSRKATPNADGSYTLHFNSGDDAINNLEVVKNWNGLFRCYLPESVGSILEFKAEVMANLPQSKTSPGHAHARSSVSPLADAKLHGDEVISTPYGEIELEDTFIADGSSQTLFDALDLQRAAQAYIWSHPLVSMTTWRNEQAKAYGVSGRGGFVVLQSYNEKLGIVTANLTTPYIFNFDNVEGDPLFIDYPAGATAGGILDMWQRPIADLGLTGPDAGTGGTYLVVAPNDDPNKYEGKADFVVHSPNNNIFVGLRLLDPSPEFAARFRDELQIAPVDGDPVELEVSVNANIPWSATAPRGVAYFEVLHQILNEEPVREQDKVWIAMLEPLGIELGKPFEPTPRQARILAEGAALGELMQRNIQINPRFAEPYWADTNWYKSFDFGVEQITDTKVELDERALWFYEAVTSSQGMVNPTVGKGQVYMTSKRDVNGELLRADRTYRLRVPSDVPVARFWSLTLYSENTRRAYESGAGTIASASRDSTNDLVVNADGSVDLYIGPSAPAGFENNHMPTVEDDGWFVYFRLYGPLEPWFDKSWSLPDFVPVDG